MFIHNITTGSVVLPASPDVGNSDDPVEVLHEDESRDAEAGLDVDVEAAVTVDERGVRAVASQTLSNSNIVIMLELISVNFGTLIDLVLNAL